MASTCADIATLGPNDWVAWDTETTGFNLFNGDHITGLSFCYLDFRSVLRSDYIPIAHPIGRNVQPVLVQRLVAELNNTEAAHVMHNAQFDWAAAHDIGIRPKADTIDTMTEQWLRDENQPKALKTLGDMYLDGNSSREQRELKELMGAPTVTAAKKLVKTALPELSTAEREVLARQMARKRGWGDLTPDDIAAYAAKDAELTYDLADYLGADVQSPVSGREMRVQQLLYQMRRRGVRLDPEGLQAAQTTYLARIKVIAEQYEGTDLGSPKQVGELLFDKLGLPVLERTPGGAPSTSKNALEQHEGNPHVELLMEYRRMSKAVSAYTIPLLRWLEYGDRIHPFFSATGTVTGRLSCKDPNLMQIPRGDTLPEVKAAFRPADGLELWEFDLAQAELRVAASMSKDRTLTSALLEGRDLHTETALAMFGRADGRWRTLAKNVNFGILYGAGPNKVAVFLAKVGMSPQQAKTKAFEALKAHRAMFPELHRLSNFLSIEAERRGKLPLHPPGRYRHFKSPGLTIPTHKALNALVQGGVAEFVKDVMLSIEAQVPGVLVLQIHDALVFECEPGMQQEIGALLGEISNDLNPFSLPMQWDAKLWR